MTRYFYDTEFLKDGTSIELISIGIVTDDGREYYAINSDADWDRIRKDDWLMANVVSSLPTHSTGQVKKNQGFGASGYSWGGIDLRSTEVKPKWVIANEVREFILAGAGEIELWADYAAYDHVVLAQLFGKMIHLPKGFPMFTHDLQQLLGHYPNYEVPEQSAGQHNALEDARHLASAFSNLMVSSRISR